MAKEVRADLGKPVERVEVETESVDLRSLTDLELQQLKRTLQPGEYSVTVGGKAPQPRSCGNKTKTATLKFE